MTAMVNPISTPMIRTAEERKEFVEKYNTDLAKSTKKKDTGDVSITSVADVKKKQQAFLMLLMTQIKHQDPMEPEKPGEMISKLVEFTQLEQQLLSRETQENSLKEQRTTQALLAANVTGKEVHLTGKDFYKGEGEEIRLQYEASSELSSPKLIIRDKQNNNVKVVDLKSDQGTHIFNWDGKNEQDELCPEGEYSFEVIDNSKDSKKRKVKINHSVYQIAKGVGMRDERPQFKTGGNMLFPVSSLLSIQSIENPKVNVAI